MSENFIKCVAVGDGFVGKTSLLMRLSGDDRYNDNYTPTIFDNHSINTVYNEQTYQIMFVDTAGQEEYVMLRKQLYESAHIFLVCFSVAHSDTFLNVKQTWLPEIEDCPSTSKILIGTKSDLRNDTETIDKLNASGSIFISRNVAENFANRHNMKYVECSSSTKENIPDVLKAILELHTTPKKEDPSISNSLFCISSMLQYAKRAICCKSTYL